MTEKSGQIIRLTPYTANRPEPTVVRVIRGEDGPLNGQEEIMDFAGPRLFCLCAARRRRYSPSGKVLARRLMSQHPRLCRSAAHQSCLGGWSLGYSVFP